jgi:hypothetical protein
MPSQGQLDGLLPVSIRGKQGFLALEPRAGSPSRVDEAS